MDSWVGRPCAANCVLLVGAVHCPKRVPGPVHMMTDAMQERKISPMLVQKPSVFPVLFHWGDALPAKSLCDNMGQINMDACRWVAKISQFSNFFRSRRSVSQVGATREQNTRQHVSSQKLWKRGLAKCVEFGSSNYSSFPLFGAENQFESRKNRCRGEPRPANVRSRWSGRTRPKLGNNAYFCLLYQLGKYEA